MILCDRLAFSHILSVIFVIAYTGQVLGDSLREIYRLLKHVESCDKDELTRVHAQAVLGELDKVMRNYIFPEQSKELSKKISILEII